MAQRYLAIVLLFLFAFDAAAAPELSDADRQRLELATTDNDDVLDQSQSADGLYVLLRNASTWQADDFAGDAGAATAPPPDYQFIKDNPQQARGNVYLIDGWVMLHDRYPSAENHKRDKLMRSGDPAWGDQVTRWTLATKKKDASSTIIVLFNDPRGQIADPGERTKVQVAARFYKLWTIPDANGNLFTYSVFVGGASEVVREASTGSDGGSSMNIVLVCIIAVTGAFFVIRHLLNRGSGGNLTQQRLEEIRQKRERLEEEQDELIEEEEDLPEDPVEALEALRERHESD